MNVLPGIELTDLPSSLQGVAVAIGFEATLTLVKHFGGAWVFVPTADKCKTDHVLSRMLGFDKLLALADLIGGERLEVPRAAAAVRAVRDRRIIEMAAAKTQRHIALELGITERQVRNILKRAPAETSRQQDFFAEA